MVTTVIFILSIIRLIKVDVKISIDNFDLESQTK